MREIWLIGSNVFRQLLRNRILTVLLLFALALVGVAAFLGDLGQEAEVRLSRDFGLMSIEMIGFFTVLLCHVVLLFEETELKTTSILFVKPLKRWHYMAGKVLGSAMLLALNQAAMLLLMALVSTWRGLPWIVDAPVVVAALYLFFSGLLFSIVTVFFSIYASTVPACAVYSSFVFFIGHFTTNMFEWAKRMQEPAVEMVVRALYYISPNFSLFNLKDNMTAIRLLWYGDIADNYSLESPSTIMVGAHSLEAYLWPLAYLASYGGCLLLLALWRYEHKEY
jgi:ABC-type transport system involved in multi-copper enzyme maturation permease subunit